MNLYFQALPRISPQNWLPSHTVCLTINVSILISNVIPKISKTNQMCLPWTAWILTLFLPTIKAKILALSFHMSCSQIKMAVWPVSRFHSHRLHRLLPPVWHLTCLLPVLSSPTPCQAYRVLPDLFTHLPPMHTFSSRSGLTATSLASKLPEPYLI